MRNPISSSSTAPGTSSPASKTPCCTKVGMKRGPWTPEEDEILANYIRREGGGRWRTLPKRAGLLRCGKSCRLRWMNYLRPSVKRGHIAPDEEDLILRLHRLLGNRWSLIAGRIPGRTDNEIKNYWNTHLSKKLISQGIDPRTHKPLNSNPNSSINIQAPATKPNPNPNPNSSGVGPVEGDSHGRIIINKDDNENFKETNLDGKENWQNSLINEDDDIGYCTDDVFSSFLNSLINEEMFVNQQHQLQNPNSGASLDPLIFSSETTVWETALASSTAPLNPEEHKRFVDHINMHF